MDLLAAAPDVLQPFVGRALPLAAVLGMREEGRPAVPPEIGRTISGRTIVLPSPAKAKWAFRLTNSGAGVIVPPVADYGIGRILQLRSATTKSIHTCVVIGFVDLSLTWGSREAGWTMDLEEEEAPK